MNIHQDSLKKILEEMISSSSAKFNESVDVAVNLGIDSSQSNQHVRGTVILPNGVGNNIRVAVFTQNSYLRVEARDVGADIIGGEDLVEEIKNGGRKLDVNWCITTPDFIVKITPIAKMLSAKGLMPNPKFNTVTSKIIETIKIIKSGHQVRFKTDKGGVIHGKLGSVKFNINDLLENLKAFLKAIKENKPASFKGIYFKSIFLSLTMSKAYKISKIEDIV